MSPISAIPPMMSGIQMPAEIAPLSKPAEIAQPEGISPAQPSESFGSMLGRMVADVNAQQNFAAQSVAGLQAGQNVPLHQAVIAMEEANVSFQLMVEVRNRLLESYQEIMRMQI